MSDSSLVEAVASRLREAKVSFALIGAVAMAAHGVSRSTADLDLLALSPALLSDAFWHPLAASGAVVEVRKGDQDDPLLGVVRIERDSESVDVVVGRHSWQVGVLARATEGLVFGGALPVVRASDLILLKLFAGGYQDRWDIQQLLSGADSDAIQTEVREQLAALPEECGELFCKLVAER
jgi:hypothetical protein